MADSLVIAIWLEAFFLYACLDSNEFAFLLNNVKRRVVDTLTMDKLGLFYPACSMPTDPHTMLAQRIMTVIAYCKYLPDSK